MRNGPDSATIRQRPRPRGLWQVPRHADRSLGAWSGPRLSAAARLLEALTLMLGSAAHHSDGRKPGPGPPSSRS
eukprot:4702229-Pyramimonas_sp.AAC.1